MTKPVIVTRAAKGSPLTRAELDGNFTNLDNATWNVSDGTNSKAFSLNDTLQFTAGTNISVGVDGTTGAVTITNTASSGISNVSVSDVSADTNTWNIPFVASGVPSFTSVGVDQQLTYIPSSNTLTANISGAHNGTVGATTPSTGAFTTLSASTTTTNGAINLTYNPSATSGSAIQVTGKDSQGGTGYLDFLKATNNTSGVTNGSKTFRLNSTGAIEIINNAYSATILSLTDAGVLTTNAISFKETREAIYDIGTTGGTIAPNAANGSVQKITLNSALTINAFTSPVAGQSLTLFIYGGNAYTSITSTMKFAGGVKTLTGTTGCIDVLSIYYDGTTYFASLGKGYA